MVRVVEDAPYLEVDTVWAVGQEPPVPSTEDNGESENEVSTDVETNETTTETSTSKTVQVSGTDDRQCYLTLGVCPVRYWELHGSDGSG